MAIVTSLVLSLGATPKAYRSRRPDIESIPPRRISPIGDYPPACNHPAVQVFSFLETDSNDEAITIGVARSNGPSRVRSDPPAQTFIAARNANARHWGARRVGWGPRERSTPNTNALAVNFNGVAVDDGGHANDLFLCASHSPHSTRTADEVIE
jgi:hypothetical protein